MEGEIIDGDKTNEQLVGELAALHWRMTKLEKLETRRMQAGEYRK